MKKYIIIITALFILASYTAAYNVNFQFFDINTKQPIENINLSIYDGGTHTYYLSDATGLINFNAEDEIFYNYTKTGYFGVYTSTLLNITADSNNVLFPTPISELGILRLRIADQTLSSHEFCIYDSSNDRLDGCYKENDTIILIVNRGYIIKPIITKSDFILSGDNFEKAAPFLLKLLLPFTVLLMFIISLYLILRKK